MKKERQAEFQYLEKTSSFSHSPFLFRGISDYLDSFFKKMCLEGESPDPYSKIVQL